MASSAELLQLKNEVIALLNSNAVQRIHFVAESVKIDHQFYADLAGLVSSGALKVDVRPELESQHKSGQYHTATNTLDLLRVNLGTTLSKGFAVHELTHAAIDYMNLRPSRGLHQTENEGIAYIAMRIYSRHVHHDPVKANWPRLLHVADAIAGRIVAAEPHLYHVTQDEMRSMRNAVGQHPIYQPYRGRLTPSDGIW